MMIRKEWTMTDTAIPDAVEIPADTKRLDAASEHISEQLLEVAIRGPDSEVLGDVLIFVRH